MTQSHVFSLNKSVVQHAYNRVSKGQLPNQIDKDTERTIWEHVFAQIGLWWSGEQNGPAFWDTVAEIKNMFIDPVSGQWKEIQHITFTPAHPTSSPTLSTTPAWWGAVHAQRHLHAVQAPSADPSIAHAEQAQQVHWRRWKGC